MLKTSLLTLIAGAGIVLAPLASASPDDLTNQDVAGGQKSEVSDFYRVVLPETPSGGQGPYPHNQTYTFDPDGNGPLPAQTKSYGPFDDGLSDSSRAVLDRVNYPATP